MNVVPRRMSFLLPAILLMIPVLAMAQAPALINYQGRLLDGTSLVNGNVSLSLRLFNAASGGSLQYEDSNTVTVVDGLYSTFIGDNTTSGSLAGALTNAQVWVEVMVNGTALSPRELLASVAYALNAQSANGVIVGGVTASMLATGAVQSAHLAAGSVGSVAIADGAVGAAALGANSVTTAALADGAVTIDKISASARVSMPVVVLNPTPVAEDRFGCAVANVGTNGFIVGSYGDDTGASNAGMVHLYNLNGVLVAAITNPTPAADDYFGMRVAGVGANRFVVSAYGDNTGASKAGSVYLYDFNGVLVATITNPAPAANDFFGYALAGVGTNRFMVGAAYDDAGAADSGSAYLYDINGVLLATITNPAPASSDLFGWSVGGVGTNNFVVGAMYDDTGASGAGSVYLYDIHGVLLATITNPAPASWDCFGRSVAGVGQGSFVVGASWDDAGTADAGSVYLYDINGVLLATVANPAPAADDNFGECVAGVGSNMFIVGAFSDDAGLTNSGSAYLYDLNGVLVAVITNPVPGLSDSFSMSVSGAGENHLVIGASGDDDGASNAGTVYLYTVGARHVDGLIAAGVRYGGVDAGMLADGAVGSRAIEDGSVGAADLGNGSVTGSKLADGAVGTAALGSNSVTTAALADGAVTIDKISASVHVSTPVVVLNPTPVAEDHFGCAVANVGTKDFIVGSYGDDTGASNAGMVHLYNLNGVLVATITNPTPAVDDYFGMRVASVGTNRFVVSAYEDNTGASGAGCVYLYDLSGVLVATITNPAPAANDFFGYALADVGTNRFVVGAAYDDAGASDSGSVYLYDINGVLLATITNPAPAASDFFGRSVAGVGINRFVVGAMYDDTGAIGAGSAYLYDINGVLLATITNPAPAINDVFGRSVAGVGPDRFVVGASWDDVGATDAGSVYLYDINGVLLATVTNPAPADGDYFGECVACVGSNMFVVGAYSDDAGLTNSGSAYLYDLNGGLVAAITNPTPGLSDSFSMSVSGVGENHLVIGASGDDDGASNAGTVYLYTVGARYVDGLIAAGVRYGGVDAGMLADGAVGSSAIEDGSVGAADLGNGSVTSNKLADGAIFNIHIAANAAIAASKIANTALVETTSFSGDVTGLFSKMKLANGVVSNAILAAGAVTGDKIAGDTVTTNNLDLVSVDGRYVKKAGDTMTGMLTNQQGVAAGRFVNLNNSVSGTAVAALGGSNNTIAAGANYSVIGGGLQNSVGANAQYGMVAGGFLNTISTNADLSAIGGGVGNYIDINSAYSVIAGGYSNTAGSDGVCVFIGSGDRNQIGPNSDYSVIGGGQFNVLGTDVKCGVIGGGWGNNMLCGYSVIGGGYSNLVGEGSAAVSIGGGDRNRALTNAGYSTIVGGRYNVIGDNSSYSTIAGGRTNLIGNGSSYSVIGGGYWNEIADNVDYAFAGGRRAKANHHGAFVWGDSTSADVTSTNADSVTFRCQGGVRFLNTNGSLYAAWTPGAASWTIVSDREMKEGIAPVDTKAVLDKVMALPISEWNYVGYPQRHIGPMAQDFHAAFPLNPNEKAIDSGDLPGISLAAIQELARENARLKVQLEAMKARLDALEKQR